VERYRNVEFDRTWNRQISNPKVQDTGFAEDIASGRLSVGRQGVGAVFYQLGLYDRATSFDGVQHSAGANFNFKKNQVIAEGEWINTSDRSAVVALKNEVDRYRLEYARELPGHVAGIRFDSERSLFTRGSDTLVAPGYAFDQSMFYLRNTDSAVIAWHAEFSQREDYLPRGTDLGFTTLGRNFTSGLSWIQLNNNRLSLSFSFRDLVVNDTNLVKVKPERTVLTRAEYDYSFLKRVFTANTYYQLGSGQELRRDFQYVEVPVGQGTYIWKDFNSDDRQQLNEFVPASFIEKNQANYIRVFLTSTTSIRTHATQLSQTLNINPSAVWNNKRGIRKGLSRFSTQTALKIDRKTTELGTADFINPFVLGVKDSQLISLSSVVRNTVFFNRADPTFGGDYSITDNQSKIYLTNGFDSRQKREHAINARFNPGRVWGISVTYTTGHRGYFSDFFATNSYQYDFDDIRPRWSYQLNQRFRATLLFGYFEGRNRIEFNGARGTSRESGIELRYNATNSGVVNVRFSHYQVSFRGDISSPVGYDMLNGLTVGQNMVWNLNFQQRLGNNLQVNVNYDGRRSEGSDIIHVGRMEARYLF
jgi:hypothetical protein